MVVYCIVSIHLVRRNFWFQTQSFKTFGTVPKPLSNIFETFGKFRNLVGNFNSGKLLDAKSFKIFREVEIRMKTIHQRRFGHFPRTRRAQKFPFVCFGSPSRPSISCLPLQHQFVFVFVMMQKVSCHICYNWAV